MATKLETKYAKNVFLCANLVFAILGYVFLVGNILSFQTNEYLEMGIFGVLLIILTYLGLFSRFKDDNFMTIIFSACLLVIFFAEMSIALTDIATGEHVIKKSFLKKMRSKETRDMIYIDNFQIQQKCCGWAGPSDWTTLDLSIPASCCAKNIKDMKHIRSCNSTTQGNHFVGCGKIYYQKHSRTILQNSNTTQTVNNRTKSTNTHTKKNFTVPIKNQAATNAHNIIESNNDKNDIFFKYGQPNEPEEDVTTTVTTDLDFINNTNSVEVSTEMINDYDVSKDLENFNSTSNADNSTEEIRDYYEEYEEDDKNDEKDPSDGGDGGDTSSNKFRSKIPSIVLASLLG